MTFKPVNIDRKGLTLGRYQEDFNDKKNKNKITFFGHWDINQIGAPMNYKNAVLTVEITNGESEENSHTSINRDDALRLIKFLAQKISELDKEIKNYNE